jgi:hypothetical protein
MSFDEYKLKKEKEASLREEYETYLEDSNSMEEK